MLKEVHVTIGQKTGRDLASRDITISISLIDEAGTELNRRRSDIVHEETLMNQRRLDGGSGGAGPRSSGEVTNKIQRSGQAQYATSQWRERPTMLPVPRLDSEGNVSIQPVTVWVVAPSQGNRAVILALEYLDHPAHPQTLKRGQLQGTLSPQQAWEMAAALLPVAGKLLVPPPSPETLKQPRKGGRRELLVGTLFLI